MITDVWSRIGFCSCDYLVIYYGSTYWYHTWTSVSLSVNIIFFTIEKSLCSTFPCEHLLSFLYLNNQKAMPIIFHFLLSAFSCIQKKSLKICGSERPVKMVSSLKQTASSDRKDERCREKEREDEYPVYPHSKQRCVFFGVFACECENLFPWLSQARKVGRQHNS